MDAELNSKLISIFREKCKSNDLVEKIYNKTISLQELEEIGLDKPLQDLKPLNAYLLGLAYHLGSGVPFDKRKGESYFKYVKEKGNEMVLFDLALAYSSLDGYEEEAKWCLKEAANMGHSVAQDILDKKYI